MRPLGLWRDSRWTYGLGAFPAAFAGCALGIMWATSSWGWVPIEWVIITGVPAGLVLSLCSVFGYHMVAANPRLHVVVRWIALCALTWLFLAMVLILLFITNADVGLRVIAPLATAHAIWTALFLIGRRAPED